MGEVVNLIRECAKYRALVEPYEDGSGAAIEITATLNSDDTIEFEIESNGLKHTRSTLHELITVLSALAFKIDELAPQTQKAPPAHEQ